MSAEEMEKLRQTCLDLQARYSEALATQERLRSALKGLIDVYHTFDHTTPEDLVNIAKAALRPKN